jgi:hypothetical protein
VVPERRRLGPVQPTLHDFLEALCSATSHAKLVADARGRKCQSETTVVEELAVAVHA